MLKLVPIFSLALAVSLATACKKDETAKKAPAISPQKSEAPSTDKPTRDKLPTTTPDTSPAKASEADVAAALAVMAPYETCREKLAADKADVAECAAQIADAAGKKSDGAASEAMKEIALAAAALAKVPSGDVDAVRLAFGEVSKPVEAMLTAIPAAAAKYKMYDCPMAKGFKRWAQPVEGDEGDKVAMANPYMGTKMLTCGSEVHDHHMGAMKQGETKHGDMKQGEMKHGDIKHGDTQ